MKFSLIKKAGVLFTGMLMSLALYSTTAFAANYTVIQDDSLFKIGLLFNTSASALMTDNQLTSDVIHPGQLLKVNADLYTVKSGDSLYLISMRLGIPLSSLRIANNKWDDMILPGQQLILPGIKPTTSTTLSTAHSKTLIPYTQEEVNLLARLINAEAGGEPYEAMVGVGAVVVNRVRSSDWPSSINSVIYQVIGEHYQFTPVKNGYINTPPTDVSFRAAWAALYGSDPSLGAIFYFDNTSTNQWIWSRPITAYIGKMVYAK